MAGRSVMAVPPLWETGAVGPHDRGRAQAAAYRDLAGLVVGIVLSWAAVAAWVFGVVALWHVAGR